ncbi:hypothetical protein BWI17_17895 [Betaproteobacteria bacterium GR16-43]|nr:hypothetical protein BWI17_17895 [Betaproteobacteria bacterium GR16-43]
MEAAVPGIAHDFCEALAAEYFEVAAFVELLEVEQRAIQDGQVEKLEALQPEKQVRVVSLTAFARKRSRMLLEMGYRTGTRGIAALAADFPAEQARMLRTWQTLESKVWEANHLSRLNAHLCTTHLLHFQARLIALTSAAASNGGTQSSGVYGEDGAVALSNTTRALAQA